MEYKDIYKRVSNTEDIKYILKEVCIAYKIGEYKKHKIVEIGYEDFNVILDTTFGKYFVKILNEDRTNEECQRLANIYETSRKNNINVPKIYKNDNKLILKVNRKNTVLRILLMEYIKGINMYELGRELTLEEIRQVAIQASNINRIDFKVEPYYDEWTLTNFKSEYDKKCNLICEEDKEIVDRCYKEFIKIDLDDLPKAYIHGDIMNANLIKDEEKIWLIDFSALSYLPRIIELVVMTYGICVCNNREESIKRLNYMLNIYNKQNQITEKELDKFNTILNAMGAMSIMQASYIKKTSGNFEENQYWIDKGKETINLNLKREEIIINNRLRGDKKMGNEFLDRIHNITEPTIERKIYSGDAYTICDILEQTKGGANGIYLKKLENAIIDTNDIVQIYEFMFLAADMNIGGFDRERFEKTIRESQNPKLMCYCMEFVPDINMTLMIQALVKTKNAKYMEMLIQNEEYRDVLEKIKQIIPNYEELVEEAKTYDYYPKSLEGFRDLKDNIRLLKEEVKNLGNPHLVTELANYIEYLNEYKGKSYEVDDLAIVQQKLKDPMQAYEFLASVDIKDKSGLVQMVINSGRVKFMFYVYEYVEGLTQEDKEKLKGEIVKRDLDGKYKQLVKDTQEIKEEGIQIGENN